MMIKCLTIILLLLLLALIIKNDDNTFMIISNISNDAYDLNDNKQILSMFINDF